MRKILEHHENSIAFRSVYGFLYIFDSMLLLLICKIILIVEISKKDAG